MDKQVCNVSNGKVMSQCNIKKEREIYAVVGKLGYSCLGLDKEQ